MQLWVMLKVSEECRFSVCHSRQPTRSHQISSPKLTSVSGGSRASSLSRPLLRSVACCSHVPLEIWSGTRAAASLALGLPKLLPSFPGLLCTGSTWRVLSNGASSPPPPPRSSPTLPSQGLLFLVPLARKAEFSQRFSPLFSSTGLCPPLGPNGKKDREKIHWG